MSKRVWFPHRPTKRGILTKAQETEASLACADPGQGPEAGEVATPTGEKYDLCARNNRYCDRFHDCLVVRKGLTNVQNAKGRPLVFGQFHLVETPVQLRESALQRVWLR